ncbi:cysteine hydrolase family protein [Rossellomorea aquimaris]|uniref:Cysteine hydrolase n=1 Tax=Rossellomorea aquimaris TaxID=189382 RepID=A0A5D4TK58_9BACI|nr:cysteine hydrolase family protein [Rossellomorea aquimaris]TYS76283.1 cysteine hydrolase [Rossellomorea aquimaris]
MKTALLVIDVQRAMFTMEPPVHKGNELLKNIQKMISYARDRSIPLIFVQHSGPNNSPLEKNTEGWGLHDNLSPAAEDMIIHKKTPDSFYETSLQKYLRQMEIEHLIITGIQTEACVDTACRIGFSLGYKMTLVKDAHSTFHKETLSASSIIEHHNEVLRWFAETVSTEKFISS